MNELEILKVNLNAQKGICRNTLIARLNSLRSMIECELENLKDENYSPSQNGIIQGEGSVIDTLAVKLAVLNEMSK